MINSRGTCFGMVTLVFLAMVYGIYFNTRHHYSGPILTNVTGTSQEKPPAPLPQSHVLATNKRDHSKTSATVTLTTIITPAQRRAAWQTQGKGRVTHDKEHDFMTKMPDFLPNYKNPCWFVGDPSEENLRCIPYFHMPGVAKSGSSTLCDCLNFHPEIAPPRKKELNYWHRKQKDVAMTYPKLFVNASLDIFDYEGFDDYHYKITYDCTPHNFWITWLPEFLVKIYKNTHVVVIMRNPTDRSFSEYHHRCVHDEEIFSPEIFDQRMREAVKLFNRCVEIDSVDTCVRRFHENYLVHGVYITYIRLWMKHIGRSNMFFLKSEDMYNRTVDALDETFDFLGMESPDESAREKIRFCMNNRIYPGLKKLMPGQHNYKIPSSPSDVVLVAEAKNEWNKYRVGMLPGTRNLLDDFYAPYNKMLAELLDDERFLFDDNRLST